MLSAFENSKVYCKPSTRCPITSRSTPCPLHCCEWVLRSDLSELHQPSALVFGFWLGSASGRHKQEIGGWKGKTSVLSPPPHPQSKKVVLGYRLAMVTFLY